MLRDYWVAVEMFPWTLDPGPTASHNLVIYPCGTPKPFHPIVPLGYILTITPT